MTLTTLFPQCQDLQAQVEAILQLLQQEPNLRSQQDGSIVQASLRKAIAPTFEIVFAGAFSAGKSMLINALLERELLYSAEGHATGTECKIAFAKTGEERVVLTFLSEVEVREQVQALSQLIGQVAPMNINQPEALKQLQTLALSVIEQEGGKSKSKRAKDADALNLLLEGFTNNRDRISSTANATYSMEQFGFDNLKKAADYARRGANSAVLKRVEYYCNHPLLQDGNVIIDTPGIDAPVKKDAALTFDKIEHPDTSAVVFVLKTAATGEMTSEETELSEKMQGNAGIRDRVFYVFNRIDETWTNDQLRDRLNHTISSQFRNSSKIYKTSGLLGFYGSQLKNTSISDRFGLDSVFAESVKSVGGEEGTPQFVNEFNSYCLVSGKLDISKFPIPYSVLETNVKNEKYVRLLSHSGTGLIEQLIKDSGIEEFRTAITRYLTIEKRPLLFADLADDLQPICIALRQSYLEAWLKLESQPRDIEAIKSQELQKLSQDLKQIGDRLRDHIAQEVNVVVASDRNELLEADYLKLKTKMVRRLDELIVSFSVAMVHQRAQASHRRNSVVPVMGILTEGFYFLANELEDVLVECSKEIIANFFQNMIEQIKKADYYRELYRLLGNDGETESYLQGVMVKASEALVNEAKTECDRYVRERPEFYAEGNVVFWQLQQALHQACRGYDYQSMIDSEPAIRQFLKLDFEYKVKDTVIRTFRQTINQTLNTHLLGGADNQADKILQQYDRAREYLAQTLEKEAQSKVDNNRRLQGEVKQNIDAYNAAVSNINQCLEAMQLTRKKLPIISESDLLMPTAIAETIDTESSVVDEVEDTEV
ncbi:MULTISPECIES: dynamin family protein [Pseudanabaena]|jgi:replication fork clamp-binding protein CrfC|uniref:dynamin family protein n=1 Tax=Pseudanabaena TaxID=1152 RepID=UPI00247A0880|nr:MULTISPECIES: dynamin family protein [Pseudanabaena]MEA5486776.1 dynamin family protein [Pseudanabaena sp. CCNP1317]WGS71133.1 dynamin family protein [Pseudanabaena galeata CCNP1313]